MASEALLELRRVELLDELFALVSAVHGDLLLDCLLEEGGDQSIEEPDSHAHVQRVDMELASSEVVLKRVDSRLHSLAWERAH